VGRAASADTVIPSGAWLFAQSSVRPAGIALMGSAIPMRRCLSARPGGFPDRPSRAKFLVRPAHLSPNFAALQGFSRMTLAGHLSTSGSFPGLSSPMTLSAHEVRCVRACLPATFRPQGLVTLSTVCSLTRLAGFISRRQRLWGSPFGAFSSLKVDRHFGRSRPACRYHGLRFDPPRADRSLSPKPGLRVLP
jgi:hypothetical protein